MIDSINQPPLPPTLRPGQWFFRPYGIQVAQGVPVDQLATLMMNAANYLSALGWEVILPPQIMASGGPVIGSQKLLNVLVWIRCPADSPLVHQDPGPLPGTVNQKEATATELNGSLRETVLRRD